MKKILFLVFTTFFFHSVFSQFTDNFTDGDISNNPTWIGDTNNYTVNASFQMQLNAPAVADVMYASTPSPSINNAVWEFYVQFNFNPSSTNLAKVYLVADQPNLKNPLNGYFVKIGNTADEVSLYRQDGTTETMIIDGVNGRLNTTQVTVSIQVTRDNLGNWQLFSDTLGGTNYFLEGSIFDNNHISSAYFGVVSIYTATRSTLFFYDNISVTGTAFIDNVPPTIDSVVVVNTTNLDVYFNEPVDLITSQTLTNYSVDNGIGNPNSATRDLADSSIVHLSFPTPFNNGQNYILSVTNVEDTASNPINILTVPFTYFVVVNPNKGDVIINEIFADPTPQVGLPIEEFVELYNTSNNVYNLNGWKFINTTTIKILPNFILQPNSYVILCDVSDTALFAPFGAVIGIPSFTALTNGGDSLSLLDNNNTILNIVAYSNTWYKDNIKKNGGWTLERVNPFAVCDNSDNWTASMNPIGGTPGTQNSVFDTTPDSQAPSILSVENSTATLLEVSFSETMDSLSVANAIYTISGGITITGVVVGTNLKSVFLTISPMLDSSTVYALQIQNATDCAGNPLNPISYNFGIGNSPLEFEVVITELFPDYEPSIGLPEQEYLELFNNTNKIINLAGCFISDLSTTAQITNGKILPGEYIIICSNSVINQFSPFGKVIGVSSLPSLNNATDKMSLLDPNSNVVHSVRYFDSWYRDEIKKQGGWSLEMIDPNNPCGEADNWIASTKWFGGTPGTPNTALASNLDVFAPKLLEANATSDSTVVLTFNEILNATSVLAATYSITHGISVASVQVLDEKTVKLNLSNKLVFQVKYTVSVVGAFDCVGNVIGTSNTAIFALPEQGFKGDLIINEVLFNPFTGGSDFVEIYNNSNKFINLQDWYLANLSGNTIANLKTIISKPKLLLPGEFVLLTKDANNITLEYLNSKTNTFIQMASLPTYNNGDGTVVLLNNLNMVVDSFNYNEDMHFSLLNSVKGVSLERIDYNRPTNDKTNWHSAAEDVGFATPGFENSQFQRANIDEENITIDPKTFSPNNDGVDDVLNISYNFSTPGFVATIVIYDAKGRLVRNLIKNELLGTKGTFSWDGINENREKSRIGIYIIYVEVFKLDGTTQSFKKTAVLAGRFD
ncbi:MAG: lamin tail domain-containing protein [Vicingaceae bacterium]|nr:lamin tail domain-containing protein [Vicingaceae bacterium]